MRATVDRQEIGEDESVTLEVTITSGTGGSVLSGTGLSFDAPDFDEINRFDSSSVQTTYDSAKGFVTNVTQRLHRMLRPRKTGVLSIRNIRADVSGVSLSSPDLNVTVRAAGAGTPPPRGYGGGGVGLRGAAKRQPGVNVMLRAEISKDRLYKGEQAVVSYYLYRRVRMANIEVQKFPELKGFLREELEMPVMGTRLDSERVMLDGVPYDRSLLVRYAAYPLQEGKLRLDPVGIKYNYFPQNAGMDDGEDPFLGFFSQFAARTGQSRSEPLTVEVEPLPSEGRPSSFSGGVGNFRVDAAADKTEVRANEAVTLTVKVEGRGNLAAIGEPKAKWPETVELYDSKGQAKSVKGVGEKVFEIVLVPRAPGKIILPALEFSFFDPEKKRYVTQATEPIPVNVLPGTGAPGPQNPRSSGEAQPAGAPPKPEKEELRELKAPGTMASDRPVLSWISWGAVILGILLALWMGIDTATRALAKRRGSGAGRIRDPKGSPSLKRFEALREQAKKAKHDAGFAASDLHRAYENLNGAVFDSLDEAFDVGARSLPRADLGRLLCQEQGLAEPLWERISKLLEFSETVRFASGTGAVSEQAARKDLEKWVNEAESVARLLGRGGRHEVRRDP